MVTWTAWDPALLFYSTAAVVIPAQEIRGRTVDTTTDDQGRFSFVEAPPLIEGQPSYLWVTHAGFTAASSEVAADATPLEEDLAITLESGAGSSVLVLESGLPVESAEVVQRIAFPRGTRDQYEGGKFLQREKAIFLRTHRTGPEGRIETSALEHDQHLAASANGRKSAPWAGPSGGAITLELEPTFELSGVVELPDDIDEDWGRARIQVVRHRGPLSEEVGTIHLEEDGAFGPFQVALKPADRYGARLVGNTFVETEQEFPTPHPEDEVFVQLEAETGHVKWFLVHDESGVPIPRATLVTRWDREGKAWEKTHLGREDGYVMALGIPSGFFTGTLHASGYATQSVAPIRLPEVPMTYLDVTMVRGFKLAGRCLRGIEPVRDFEVRFWADQERTARGRVSVVDSEDGTFLLDSLAWGQVTVTAVSTDFERSEAASVDLIRTPDKEIILQLAPPRTARGTILDGATRSPIQGALVTVFSNHLYEELDPIGLPTQTDLAGHFELARLAEGLNVISIQADGYSDRELKVYVPEHGDADLGSISLVRTQPLTAELRLPEGEDPTQWILAARGIGAPPPTPFDSDGSLRIEEANEGAWTLEVRDNQGRDDVLASQDHWLRVGEEWHVVFDLAAGRSVLVVLEDVDPQDIDSVYVRLQYTAEDESLVDVFLFPDESGEFRLPAGVGQGPIVAKAEATVGDWSLSGTIVHQVRSDDPEEIVLSIPLGENSRRLRVVDKAGDAVAGVMVLLESSQSPGAWLSQATSDADGIARLDGVTVVADRVELTSKDGGKHTGIALDLPSDPEEIIEVVFDSSASIAVRVLDTGAPQSGVTCRLWDVDGHTLVASGQSPDSEGRLRIEGLCPGPYLLRVEGPGYWPLSRRLDAEPKATELAIEVRRTGGIAIEFMRADGTALASSPVELACLSLDESSTDWVARGLIAGAEGSLWTDPSGRLVLTGIPHGDYRWKAEGASGSLRVGAGETLDKRVVVP